MIYPKLVHWKKVLVLTGFGQGFGQLSKMSNCPITQHWDTLFSILGEWDLKEKVHIIVTNNGANIKKAIKDMSYISNNITWQPCTAHTLQLIIGKGLNPVKLLVLRAKKLIDFFLRPKQSERLEEIQKTSPFEANVVRKFLICNFII